MDIFYDTRPSRLGTLLVAVRDDTGAVCHTDICTTPARAIRYMRSLPSVDRVVRDRRRPARALKELTEYVGGTRTRFTVKVSPVAGTPFQRRVWAAIARIPYGETRTYTDMARAAGAPKAVRAAGSACGANPTPLFVPCHRVIRSDGTFEGFSGDLRVKKMLLEKETEGRSH